MIWQRSKGCPGPQPASSEHLKAWRDVLERAARIAATDVTACLQGESGTGKEVIARFIHASSLRHGPFIAINCAALPDQLVESELFRFERGAFYERAAVEVGAGGKPPNNELLDATSVRVSRRRRFPVASPNVVDYRRLRRTGEHKLRAPKVNEFSVLDQQGASLLRNSEVTK